MIKLERPLVIFDLEGTGPDPMVDRVVEIGAVLLRPDGSRKTWRSLVNPGIPIPAEASAIHNITNEMVADAPKFEGIARQVVAAFRGADMAGYNLRRYDLPLLDEELRRVGYHLEMKGVRVIDVATIYMKRMPRTLSDCVREYTGKELDGAHGALADATGTVDSLLGQLERYEELAAMDIGGLEEYSRHGDLIFADLCGNLVYDKEGFVCFHFGKEKGKGKRVVDDVGLADWMRKKDFPRSTMGVIAAEMLKHGVRW